MKAYCCYIKSVEDDLVNGCEKDAEWEITFDPNDRDREVYDFTHACTEHVGEMLRDGGVNHVFEIEAAP